MPSVDWHPDPTGRHQIRRRNPDGTWSDQVADYGVISTDTYDGVQPVPARDPDQFMEPVAKDPRTRPRRDSTPPTDGNDDGTSPRNGNAAAIAGFILSVIAVIPPAVFANHLATTDLAAECRDSHGLALMGYGLGWVLFLVPFVLIFGIPAAVLSVIGIVRARTEARKRINFGIAGLVLLCCVVILTIASLVMISC